MAGTAKCGWNALGGEAQGSVPVPGTSFNWNENFWNGNLEVRQVRLIRLDGCGSVIGRSRESLALSRGAITAATAVYLP